VDPSPTTVHALAPATSPPAVKLTFDRASDAPMAAGQLFVVWLHVENADGSDPGGTHVLFEDAGTGIPIVVLDPDVTVRSGIGEVSARMRPQAGKAGKARVRAWVAGSGDPPVDHEIPVERPQLWCDLSGGVANAWWQGSVLNRLNCISTWIDLVLAPPAEAGKRGFAVGARSQPALSLESDDVLLSHDELVLPAGPPGVEAVGMASALPPFDGTAPPARRKGTVRVSYAADPSVDPLDVTVEFPDVAIRSRRDIALGPAAPNVSFVGEDVWLALVPASGYAGTPPAPQVGSVGESLPIGFAVKVVDHAGHEYDRAPSKTTTGQPGDKLTVSWRTQGATLSAGSTPSDSDTQWLSAAIDKQVYLTPRQAGPWYLDAAIKESWIFDPQAPTLSDTGPAGPWQHHSALSLGNCVHRFIVQAPASAGGSIRSGGGPFIP
jgi:hypothetical protein